MAEKFGVWGVQVGPGLRGDATLVEAREVGGSGFELTGLPERVREDLRTVIRSAMVMGGLGRPNGYAVDVGQGSLWTSRDQGFGLPVAVALAGAMGVLQGSRAGRYALCAELGMNGMLRPVRGAVLAAQVAREQQLDGLIVAADVAPTAAAVSGVKVYGMRTLGEVVEFLAGKADFSHAAPVRLEAPEVEVRPLRMAPRVLRALEVVAVTGAGLMLVGVDGCGKSVLAGRLAEILSPGDALRRETIAAIYSAARLAAPKGGVPFRYPHHTISLMGTVGSPVIPGELMLAHGGVLTLDDPGKVRAEVLDVVRSAWEKGCVDVPGVPASQPSAFQLVVLVEPCPRSCPADQGCLCPETIAEPHLRRLAEIENWGILRVQVLEASAERRVAADPVEVVRARVLAARERLARNGSLQPYGLIDDAIIAGDEELLVKCLARVLAALDGQDQPQEAHVEEARALRGERPAVVGA